MKQEEIIARIEYVAPLWGAAKWDMSGMQVASSRKDIGKMALFLDPSPISITAALREGAEFMLSHHPLSLSPRLPDRLDAWHESLRLLFSANVGLYAAHTSLDINLRGPAGWLGRELELENTEILELEQEPSAAYPYGLGYGEVGDLSSPMPINGLVGRILEILDMDGAVICGPKYTDPIRRIAYCPGSGSSLARAARQKGAQLFITGDLKYHAALDAPLAILDVGHHGIEEEMMRKFADLLARDMRDLQIVFIPSRSPFRPVCRKILK